ncbi:hypothetical protein FZC78_06865 [Rossellomorea vietnamensis]|uniref:Uncharacterized protein n=1 Tax=Rossellomorea vietnamensis TaxID=218284 RepID=A0A5D4NTG6_9BACI|nr:hypothetical protein [Rossellomorea vietnamensis]TYS17585.1 hypothetical protein FZC78_06865 [Rossellomorea vietnamensis]
MAANLTDPCERCSEDSLLCLSVPGSLCLQILGLQLTANNLLLELEPDADLGGISELLGQLFGGSAEVLSSEK